MTKKHTSSKNIPKHTCDVCFDREKKEQKQKIVVSFVMTMFYTLLAGLCLLGIVNLHGNMFISWEQTISLQIVSLSIMIWFIALFKMWAHNMDKEKEKYKVLTGNEFKLFSKNN